MTKFVGLLKHEPDGHFKMGREHPVCCLLVYVLYLS